MNVHNAISRVWGSLTNETLHLLQSVVNRCVRLSYRQRQETISMPFLAPNFVPVNQQKQHDTPSLIILPRPLEKKKSIKNKTKKNCLVSTVCAHVAVTVHFAQLIPHGPCLGEVCNIVYIQTGLFAVDFAQWLSDIQARHHSLQQDETTTRLAFLVSVYTSLACFQRRWLTFTYLQLLFDRSVDQVQEQAYTHQSVGQY